MMRARASIVASLACLSLAGATLAAEHSHVVRMARQLTTLTAEIEYVGWRRFRVRMYTKTKNWYEFGERTMMTERQLPMGGAPGGVEGRSTSTEIHQNGSLR